MSLHEQRNGSLQRAGTSYSSQGINKCHRNGNSICPHMFSLVSAFNWYTPQGTHKVIRPVWFQWQRKFLFIFSTCTCGLLQARVEQRAEHLSNRHVSQYVRLYYQKASSGVENSFALIMRNSWKTSNNIWYRESLQTFITPSLNTGTNK